MTDGTVTGTAAFELPFSRRAELRRVEYESGLKMLRMVLREGRRITVIELDRESALAMAAEMTDWAKNAAR
ncbi:MAG: hypothetical protein D6754_12575 [Alphaproteobacteria bacterium]|nr:MAG: hypothetical protein D6754_12575 [Alphaproteobacteria bacterium]